jgi:endo-1,4-beta-D-glucanase Y
MKKTLAYILIIGGLILALFVGYKNSHVSKTQPFSKYTILTSSWEKYKTQFINKDGRVIDYKRNSITTSEGQSYAMLRAVWIDDKQTFDLVWAWTKQNLDRPNDKLFGWQWGKKANGSFGFLDNGGNNSASDADNDIALALVLASRRWGSQDYLTQAQPIIKDIWQYETAEANSKRYITAGNWAATNTKMVINPSYFAPYAWRLFATVDKQHNWISLVDPAYELLQKIGTLPLDKSKGVGLAPDWIEINRSNGDITHPTLSGMTTNYSYDAIRVPFRVALDYQWNNDPKAKAYLTTCCTVLLSRYQKEKKIAPTYSHDGMPLETGESPAMYGSVIGAFMVSNPLLAKSVYEDKIIQLYSNDTNSFKDTVGYYEQNWLWFGAALYNKQLSQF